MLKYITPPHSNGWVRRYVSILIRHVYFHVPTFLCTEFFTWLGYPSSYNSIGFIKSTTSQMSSLSNRNANNTRSVTAAIKKNPTIINAVETNFGKSFLPFTVKSLNLLLFRIPVSKVTVIWKGIFVLKNLTKLYNNLSRIDPN